MFAAHLCFLRFSNLTFNTYNSIPCTPSMSVGICARPRISRTISHSCFYSALEQAPQCCSFYKIYLPHYGALWHKVQKNKTAKKRDTPPLCCEGLLEQLSCLNPDSVASLPRWLKFTQVLLSWLGVESALAPPPSLTKRTWNRSLRWRPWRGVWIGIQAPYYYNQHMRIYTYICILVILYEFELHINSIRCGKIGLNPP